MPTRRCRTRTTTASAITESTSPWTMVEPVRSGGQPRTNGWGSSTSRACASKLSMADSPGNRSTTTAVSTSSWPVGKRSARPSRQRQGRFPHTGAPQRTLPGRTSATEARFLARPLVPAIRRPDRCVREDDPLVGHRGPYALRRALHGARPPGLVLVREPDELGLERAHPQLAFGVRLVELAEPNRHVTADD